MRLISYMKTMRPTGWRRPVPVAADRRPRA